MNIEDILKSWGLPESVIETFKENEIYENQLPSLTSDLLRELIPHIGPRLVAQQKINELKLAEEAKNDNNKVEHNDCSFSTVTLQTSSESQSGISEYRTESIQLDNIPFVIATDGDSTRAQDVENEFGDLISFLRPKFEDFDLKTLLTTSPLGKSTLSYYNTHGKLDNTRRNRLVSIIVKHLYNYIVKNRLCKEEYNVLAAKIISLFPTETLGVYYCPPIYKREHPLSKSIMAKGKLVNQVRNILFRSGDTMGRRSKYAPKRVANQSDEEGQEDNTAGPSNKIKVYENNEDVLWLQHNYEPWEKVIQKWKSTYNFRISNTEVKTVPEYFALWPVLSDIRGHILISLDFERLYPQSQVAFHLNWDNFFNKILNYKIEEIKDVNVKDLHKVLLEKTDEDEKLPLQLTLLGHLYFRPEEEQKIGNFPY